MAQYHASCHEVQSRGQEEIEHDLTGNTGIFSTCIACSSCIYEHESPKWAVFLGGNSGKWVSYRVFYYILRELPPTLHFVTACVILGHYGSKIALQSQRCVKSSTNPALAVCLKPLPRWVIRQDMIQQKGQNQCQITELLSKPRRRMLRNLGSEDGTARLPIAISKEKTLIRKVKGTRERTTPEFLAS